MMRRQAAELEALLDMERNRREKLELLLDQCKLEVGHLTTQLQVQAVGIYYFFVVSNYQFMAHVMFEIPD